MSGIKSNMGRVEVAAESGGGSVDSTAAVSPADVKALNVPFTIQLSILFYFFHSKVNIPFYKTLLFIYLVLKIYNS